MRPLPLLLLCSSDWRTNRGRRVLRRRRRWDAVHVHAACRWRARRVPWGWWWTAESCREDRRSSTWAPPCPPDVWRLHTHTDTQTHTHTHTHQSKAPSTPATTSKQHCWMLQCRMLLRQCRTSFALRFRPFDKVERCYDIVASVDRLNGERRLPIVSPPDIAYSTAYVSLMLLSSSSFPSLIVTHQQTYQYDK